MISPHIEFNFVQSNIPSTTNTDKLNTFPKINNRPFPHYMDAKDNSDQSRITR